MKEKRRILVVDDERFNIKVLVDALKSDYKTSIAINGKEALERARSDAPPDLILLDIMMPEMNGYEVCENLKADENTRGIPIIFVTAMSDIGYETKGLSMGAIDYITKPINPDIVKVRVKHHIDREQYRINLEKLVKERTANLEKSLENQKILIENEKELKRRAEDASQAKSFFLNNVSHELRTPLSAIMLNNKFLLDMGLEPEPLDFAKKVQKKASALMKIIDDVLDFSSIDTGSLSLEHSDFFLTDVIKEAAESAMGKGGEISLDIPKDIPNALVGDRKRLQRILDNLIDNGLKFNSEQKLLAIGAKIFYDTTNKVTLEFYVRDNGIGITQKDIVKLFDEPFTQGDPSTTRSYEGLGLGLSICKRLVSMMEGEIHVESRPDEGSTFIFTVVFERQGREVPFEFPGGATSLQKEVETESLENREDVDINQAVSVVEQLHLSLESMNPGSVKKHMFSLRKFFSDKELSQLLRQVDDYEYPEAAKELKRLVEKLGL